MPDRLVVVGASLAGLRAVEAVRGARPDLHITLIGAEPHAPYDRPPLSKGLLEADAGKTDSELRSAQSLHDDLGVETLFGAPATALDVDARTVTVDGREIGYDGIVLATGSSPRTLPSVGALDGVHVLRGIDDSRAIRAALDGGARTVVIGGGFIGAEIASAARARGLAATVVESLPAPLVRAVGSELGTILGRLHGRNGTTLLTGASVEAIEGNGRVQRVRLADGTVLDADLVVVGIGADPNTSWLDGSGLTLDDGVVCDKTLRAAPGVWAAGDIARWPNPVFGRPMRIQHWTNAAEQGTRAGRHAADPGTAEPYATVPYFWSDWYGSRIQCVGVAGDGPVEVVWGDADSNHFLALYRDGDRVSAGLGLGAARVVMRVRKLIADGASWDAALDAARSFPPRSTS